MARIVVDESCARTGYCVKIAPEVFHLEDDQPRASVRELPVDEDETPDRYDDVLDAEATCPMAAITVEP